MTRGVFVTLEQAEKLVLKLRRSYQPGLTDLEILRTARDTRQRIC